MRTSTVRVPATDDQWHRDLSTKKGSWTVENLKINEYLDSIDFEKKPEFQRAPIQIARNPIKRKMFRDLLVGATVPPVVLLRGNTGKWQIIDGLQRTDVIRFALNTIELIESGQDKEKLPEYTQEDLGALEKQGRQILSRNAFMNQPIICQVWQGLSAEETVQLFMTLNVGQQKIQARHLLETLMSPMREMFKDWGIEVRTQVDEAEFKEKKIVTKDKRKLVELGANFEFLLAGSIAYINKDAQIKTPKVVAKSRLDDTANELPSIDSLVLKQDTLRSDLLWVLNELGPLIRKAYHDKGGWGGATSDKHTFFVPLMAALGNARGTDSPGIHEALEGRKKDLIKYCEARENPLWLTDEKGSLEEVMSRIKGAIGRRQRAITYHGFKEYFRVGFEGRQECPINWEHGYSAVG